MSSINQALLMSGGVHDPYYSDVVFLLGTSGSNLVDDSGYASTITSSANAPTVSSAQSKWGTQSALFSGTNCSASAPNSGLLDVGTKAYTIEGWVYITAGASFSVPLFGSADAQYIEFGASGPSRLLWVNTASFGDQYVGSGIAANAWKHMAIVSAAGATNKVRIYYDGSYRGETDVFHGIGSGQAKAAMGWWRSSTNAGATFHLEDFRYTLNVERYTGTGSYTVPTEAFPRQ